MATKPTQPSKRRAAAKAPASARRPDNKRSGVESTATLREVPAKVLARLSPVDREILASEAGQYALENYEILRAVGRLMRHTRMAAGLRQVTVGKMAGIAQAEISRIESGEGERGASIVTLAKIARANKKRLVIAIVDQGEVVALPEQSFVDI
jgi:DNA-binding XRE family transcriptional regulator